ncbi:MAG: hypothetical protein CMD96_03865 [Gammaproteobacteria bacterium]|jgi:hypothetical protein|nr:hypothetical protein [Gammaproteobacteria bacterium]HJP18996.1 hypothetical protein [Nitrospinota bacterium]|tara:strand:- start:3373 stop:4059 length:687 start_codon:yes stop_codon:yes gene_type:complete
MIEVGIAWLVAAAPAIGAVSTAFTLGKDITSVFGLLSQKRGKLTPMEERFVKISPLAALVQRKVASRLLLLLMFSVLVGGIILAISIIYKEQLQGYKLVLSLIVIASFLSVNISNRLVLIKRMFISVGEIQILKEYESCYEGYIHEKIDELKLLTESERSILKSLRSEKISNASYNEINDIMRKVNNSIRNREVEAVIRKLSNYGYIKVNRKLNGRRQFSVLLATENT